jgi:hypothetical protein
MRRYLVERVAPQDVACFAGVCRQSLKRPYDGI